MLDQDVDILKRKLIAIVCIKNSSNYFISGAIKAFVSAYENILLK